MNDWWILFKIVSIVNERSDNNDTKLRYNICKLIFVKQPNGICIYFQVSDPFTVRRRMYRRRGYTVLNTKPITAGTIEIPFTARSYGYRRRNNYYCKLICYDCDTGTTTTEATPTTEFPPGEPMTDVTTTELIPTTGPMTDVPPTTPVP